MQMDKPLASSTLSPLHKYKNHITEVDATLNLEVVKFWRFFAIKTQTQAFGKPKMLVGF